MSHCVPEWDAVPGKEMDSVWEPVDLFLPSKGKWDSGHTRKSDIGSVPELNFEELCWEDGQLLVVLQGSSGRGIGKSRSCSQFNAAEANLGGDIHMDVPVDTNGTELIEPASINVQTQEDDLFSWLQHPSEDLMARHERKNDMHVPGRSLAGTERIHSPDLIMQKYSYQNPGLLNSTENIMASKSRATDTIPAFSPNNKVGHRTNQEVEDNSMNIALQNQEICGHYRPLTPTTEMSTQVAQMPSASANEIHARSVTSVNKSGMNFSNFSRPAVTYKAGLNSLGMTNGLSGTERLKQLDRVAVDVHKLEGLDSTTRYLKLNAPSREEGVVLATPSLPHVVGASGLQDSNQDFSPEMQEHQNAHSVNESQEDRDPDASITVTLNRTSAMGIADCWKSSLISSTAHGIDGSGEVVEFPEPSDLSSSGGSEDSDGTDGRRVTGRSKRKKSHEEDSELQSEALKNEAASSKKPAVMVGNTTKRSRAAENHNQSERRRRDRISEKMKALQSLVPNSYKTDKASMLEEAITYIKALKSQIQMMSCRGGMFFPQVVFPSGMQNVQMASWPVLNMGIGMNMGMGMNVGVRMTDVNGVVASAPMKPLSPMTSFPTAMRPPVNMTASTSLNPPHMTTGVAGQVIALPANQVLPVRPGVPVPGFCDSSSFSNGVLPQCFPINQQGGHVQMMPIGVQGNAASNFCQYYGPANFLGGCA